MKGWLVGSAVVVLALAPAPHAQQARQTTLVPTNHPRFSTSLADLWLVPENAPGQSPNSGLARGASLVDDGSYSQALPILSQPSLQRGPLAAYARYYAAAASLGLGNAADAGRAFRMIQEDAVGYLTQAAAIGEAEAAEAAGDFRAAEGIYDRLLTASPGATDDLWMRLAKAARDAGDTDKARAAFARVHYEFPLGNLAPEAGIELEKLSPSAGTPVAPGSERYKQQLGRAERLFAAKQYSGARSAFEALRAGARGDSLEVVRLRLAECDILLKRMGTAREALRPIMAAEDSPRRAEALYYYALAADGLRDEATYLRTIRRVADEFPEESWAAQALDHLATHGILKDKDDEADAVFRELYEKYPRSAYGERAAWKIGWRSYRSGRYAETASYFEQAAADFPRSDYRPAWLYWAGRAHEALRDQALADQRYALVAADYHNSYYGRLAGMRFAGRPAARLASVDVTGREPALRLPNGDLIRALLGAGLFDDGLNELSFAERMWGPLPSIDATRAWIYRQKGRSEKGTDQFNLYRGSINAMKRAYPQYLTAGGEDLPKEVLTSIFPIEYWALIQKHSTARNLDPYLVAALMAQESTFVPDIVSYAKAVGLMQLLPSTARMYARRLKIPYSAALLRNPEANIRMGTTYLAALVSEFGDMHLALAGYNAGEGAVRRWVAERPSDIDPEEFIDDIPYPQTQGYVKKVLGTAEDYRRLYPK